MDSAAPHPVVSREDWLAARIALKNEEKRVLREVDALAKKRAALPWVKVDKLYLFDTPSGPRTLSDLFAGRSQLIVQHFMFAPEWEEGCVGCSLGADHMNGITAHLENHDVKYTLVSRAPLAKLIAFRERMGWPFDWVSAGDGDFNYDFHVSFREGEPVYYNYADRAFECVDLPGLSVFHKTADGTIYHTYSVYSRGTELASGVFQLLDMTPKGRNETGPNGDLTDWVKHHDKYDSGSSSCGCGGKTA
ncbi:DUF899 domain-containing protein [Asticcacaulis sp. AC460]|uniref:DUF899 domain-containing protein n=1 Tax=Asticcacaulis sp. AC460 TaxID=1282360 RepID=UPI0004CEA050|nr:thioredoxin family protein [Asticcacaulis sp. AC460]